MLLRLIDGTAWNSEHRLDNVNQDRVVLAITNKKLPYIDLLRGRRCFKALAYMFCETGPLHFIFLYWSVNAAALLF